MVATVQKSILLIFLCMLYIKKLSKMVLGVHSNASNLAVKGERGCYPFHIIIYKRIFKYFLGLLSLPNNKILNSALETNIHLNNMGTHSWFRSPLLSTYYDLLN